MIYSIINMQMIFQSCLNDNLVLKSPFLCHIGIFKGYYDMIISLKFHEFRGINTQYSAIGTGMIQ